jgi:hypothetical protein
LDCSRLRLHKLTAVQSSSSSSWQQLLLPAMQDGLVYPRLHLHKLTVVQRSSSSGSCCQLLWQQCRMVAFTVPVEGKMTIASAAMQDGRVVGLWECEECQ